jgi:glycosyltransferase involved in cell wall biosynthesis
MNVLFITIGELSDLDENVMYPDLLRCFRDNGHHVCVVCQRERRYGLPTEKTKEYGIEVLRVKTGNITKTNFIEKGISTLLIGRRFKKAVRRFYKAVGFELILYSTPPITVANTVKYLKKRHNAFTYLMLKDIFPQNALDLGILKRTGWKGLAAKYFKQKEKKLYRVSDFIGCMSPANAEFLRKKHAYLEEGKIGLCPNTINPAACACADKRTLRELFLLPQDKLIFVCGGNFGKPQDVDFILKVIKSNEKKPDRHFVMCGSGTDFHKISEYSENTDAGHITVIDALKPDEYQQLLEACDVGLIFLDHRFTIPNFPSRLLDYLNHSLPILAATDKNTDIGRIITDGCFGWWCESGDEDGYNRLLEEICSDPEQAALTGRNGRIFLEENYDTRKAYEGIMKAYAGAGPVTKIALLTNILSPYRKVFYDKLYTALKERGIDFKVLIMADTEPDREWHYDEYKGDYCELLISRTATFHNIYFHFNKNLARKLYEMRPDILIASGSYIAPSVMRAIRLRKKLKYKLWFWSESHLNELRSYGGLILRIRDFIRGRVYKSFDAFWYAGSKSLDFIRKYAQGGRHAKACGYYFIPNLVDHKFFREASGVEEADRRSLRKKEDIPEGNFVFLLPARLTAVKGIIPFLELFRSCEYKDRATILIPGEGELKNDIRRLADFYRLDVRLPGYKRQEEILSFYALADCFLLPSLSDPNPLSCIEALWAGLPLLLSEHVGNYPETVKAGGNGYVFTYEKPEEAVGLIDQMISSSEEWRQSARQISLSIAKEIYEPDRAVDHLLDEMLKK